jgi:hypothetical protein
MYIHNPIMLATPTFYVVRVCVERGIQLNYVVIPFRK